LIDISVSVLCTIFYNLSIIIINSFLERVLAFWVDFLLDDDIAYDDELPNGFDLPVTSNDIFGLELSLVIGIGIIDFLFYVIVNIVWLLL